MKYAKLGHTDISVSQICLGTMNWGEQNSEAEAHEQLNYAVTHGVNFIDTAELYPVAPQAETYGHTEEYIGRWLKTRADRDKLIIATKVVGRNNLPWIRGGTSKMDAANIRAALEGSLRRLQTDYVDLYLLHWPDRKSNFFGKLGYSCEADDADTTPLEVTLAVLEDCVNSGKVRQIGVCNDSAWGAMKLIALAEKMQLPRIVTVQNPYNLLNRSYEIGLAEIAHREQVGLMAYSPLGFGVLSGKYLDNAKPEGARLTLFQQFKRYLTPQGVEATIAYHKIADQHGMTLADLAMAFVNSRRFLTSTLIGATKMSQLQANIASIDRVLSEEILTQIEAVHTQYPNPCP